MRINLFYCKDDNYSANYIKAEFKNRLLILQDGRRLEVKYDFNPQVAGHSDDRFNVMFLDDDDSLEHDERKYFCKISWANKQYLIWSYGNYLIQSRDFKLSAIGGIIGFFVGIITKYLIGC